MRRMCVAAKADGTTRTKPENRMQNPTRAKRSTAGNGKGGMSAARLQRRLQQLREALAEGGGPGGGGGLQGGRVGGTAGGVEAGEHQLRGAVGGVRILRMLGIMRC